MNNCIFLEKATKLLIPEYFDRINWNGIWKRKIESGTAFEWAVLAALINVAKANSIKVSIPLLEKYTAGDYFVLRNELPISHGAQAGNTETVLSSKSLKDRFFYSLIPKAVFYINGNIYSIFREGCPYHKIMAGQNYLERTDIIIVPGEPSPSYPILNESGTELEFSYQYFSTLISGSLRIINSPIIPCKKRNPRGGMLLKPTGIIECSVNKSVETASNQLKRYNEIFSTDNYSPIFSLITGNDLSSMPFDTHTINLGDIPTEALVDSLKQEATKILHHFSIIAQ